MKKTTKKTTTRKCWQCKRTLVWQEHNLPGGKSSRLWTPRFVCPQDCGPQALAALFRI